MIIVKYIPIFLCFVLPLPANGAFWMAIANVNKLWRSRLIGHRETKKWQKTEINSPEVWLSPCPKERSRYPPRKPQFQPLRVVLPILELSDDYRQGLPSFWRHHYYWLMLSPFCWSSSSSSSAFPIVVRLSVSITRLSMLLMTLYRILKPLLLQISELWQGRDPLLCIPMYKIGLYLFSYYVLLVLWVIR